MCVCVFASACVSGHFGLCFANSIAQHSRLSATFVDHRRCMLAALHARKHLLQSSDSSVPNRRPVHVKTKNCLGKDSFRDQEASVTIACCGSGNLVPTVRRAQKARVLQWYIAFRQGSFAILGRLRVVFIQVNHFLVLLFGVPNSEKPRAAAGSLFGA